MKSLRYLRLVLRESLNYEGGLKMEVESISVWSGN